VDAVWLLVAMFAFVAVVAAMDGPRLRPWVIGISLIVCGFAAHVAFEMWVADWAGRFEMGLFAIHEALLFLAGLGCVFASLLRPWPPGVGAGAKEAAWVLWLTTAMMAAVVVLIRLPS
jgi:hypothetical protein